MVASRTRCSKRSPHPCRERYVPHATTGCRKVEVEERDRAPVPEHDILGAHIVMADDVISDWVSQVAEGEATYQTKKRSGKSLKDEYFASKK